MTNLDIAFINPSKSKNKHDHVVNMSLFWLVAALKDEGISSRIYTILGDNFEEEIHRIVSDSNPKWIGISCKWWNTLYSATQIAATIKKLYPNIKLFSGGHTATIFAEELIKRNFFDVVLLGDSEKTIVNLFKEKSKLRTASKDGIFSEEMCVKCKEYLSTYKLVGIDDYIDRPDLVMGYVWTGRGCCHDCFYCAENISTTKKIFKERIPFVRSVDSVVSDIMNFGNRTNIIFDYEYPSFDKTDDHIEELFKKLPKSIDYRCYFFSWGLPSKRLIDLFSDRFTYSSICIDIQSFSETLRKILSEKKLIKPFFSNNDFLEILDYANQKDNLIIDATGIVGYPFETESHRNEGYDFINSLHSKYKCVRDTRPSPLHVIPGTPMTESNKYYNLSVERRTFDDFYLFTKEAFENELTYYDTNRKFHPFGVYPENQPYIIVDYMNKVNNQQNSLKAQRIKIETNKLNDYTYSLFIEDIYFPLQSLLNALNSLSEIENHKELKLIISLGYCTWFQNSWIDYTSESGENCATLLGKNTRDASSLKSQVQNIMSQFKNIKLKNSKSSAWGVIKLLKEEIFEDD